MHTAAVSFQYQFLRTLLFLAMALVLASCAEGETQSGTGSIETQDSLPENGKIAFSRERGDAPDIASDIYTIAPNGSSETRLTNDTYPNYQPDWSPDGTKIAFLGGKHFSVMVMGADGSNQRDLLTHSNRVGSFNISDFTWSPNGTKLAFDSSAADGIRDIPIRDIYTIDSDGSNPINLTRTPKLDEMNPDFSPDGSRLCFSLWNQGMAGAPAEGIYVMNANGSDPTLLIKGPNIEMVARPGECDWSPDGKKIAFTGAFKESEDSEVYVINADGSGLTNLTSNSEEDYEPDWSPDGTKITFTRATYQSALTIDPNDVYTMDADGSDVVKITKTPDVAERNPDW